MNSALNTTHHDTHGGPWSAGTTNRSAKTYARPKANQHKRLALELELLTQYILQN